jgi:hypothetical protein
VAQQLVVINRKQLVGEEGVMVAKQLPLGGGGYLCAWLNSRAHYLPSTNMAVAFRISGRLWVFVVGRKRSH